MSEFSGPEWEPWMASVRSMAEELELDVQDRIEKILERDPGRVVVLEQAGRPVLVFVSGGR